MEHRKSIAPALMAPLDESHAPAAFDGRSKFEREQERLIQEIANDFEDLLSDANALNRRIEEALGVGHGFQTIASLWGKFGELMREAKIDAESVADTSQITADTSSVSR